jgi:hypothetical protein
MIKYLATLAAVTVIGIVVVALSPLNAMNAPQYQRCLERIIAKRGFAWAVNHAGATVCDKR